MRILFVNHLLDTVTGGGTAERTFQLAKHMARNGHECSILTLEIGVDADRLADLPGVQVHALPCLNKRFFVPSASGGQMRRLVAASDVVQLSGHWTVLNAMVYQACKQTRTPYLFCPAGALKPFGRSLWLKRAYDAAVGNRILTSAVRFVAITEDEAGLFRDRGVPAERVTVIPNGIDPQQYVLADPAGAVADFRSAHGLGAMPFILFLGRLNAIKGPDLLLNAFANLAERFAGYHLVFAGPDGGLREALAVRANAAGLAERVHFVGFVGGDTKTAALSAASLLVIPSRREAMSIVVLEAGACACPVMFTDTCGLAAIASAGAATMVESNAAAIASGLESALADPQALTKKAERLSVIVARDYLWSVQAARYEALGREVLAEARR